MSTVVKLSSLLFESSIEDNRLSLDEAEETIVQEVLGNLELEGIRLERNREAEKHIKHMKIYSVIKPVPFVILDSAGNITKEFDTNLELRFSYIRDSVFNTIGLQIETSIELQNEKIRYTRDIETAFLNFSFNLYKKTKHHERYLVDPSDSKRLNTPTKDPEDIISVLTEHAINLYNKWFRQTGEIVVDESGRMKLDVAVT